MMKPELKILSFPKPEPKPNLYQRVKERLKAIHFVHDWDEYEVYKKGYIVNDYGAFTGCYVVQSSQCKICGKARMHRIES